MDVAGMAEGDRVVGVRVAHGWDAEAGAPLVILQFRTNAGDVGLVSLSADLAQTPWSPATAMRESDSGRSCRQAYELERSVAMSGALGDRDRLDVVIALRRLAEIDKAKSRHPSVRRSS